MTIFFVILFLSSHAQQATLIKDIETAGERPSTFRSLAELNGKILMSLNDGIHGEELFILNNVTAQPVLLKEILPGAASSNPRYFTKVNGKIFFVAESDAGGELWLTDGTADGTKNIVIDPHSTGFPRAITGAGDKLFFKRTVGYHQEGLFVTDGTEEGTLLLKTMTFDGGGTFPDQMAELDGILYFSVGEATWISDGTPDGTLQVTSPAQMPGIPVTYYRFNNALYFTADGKVWRWDGTEQGSYKLDGGKIQWMTSGAVFNGKFYFTATDLNGEGLWSIDSNNILTLVMRTHFIEILSAGNYLFLSASTSSLSPKALWRSDGTSAGTTVVKTLTFNNFNFIPMWSREFENGNAMVVARHLGSGADKVWFINGTTEGTVLYEKFNTTSPTFFADAPKTFLGKHFLWEGGIGRYALHYFDGTKNGSFSVQLPELNGSSAPGGFHKFKDKVVFNALTLDSGFEMWVTGGGSQNTLPLKKTPGTAYSTFIDAIEYNDELYFTRAEDNSDNELWKTDGTSQGTVRVKDIIPGGTGSNPERKFTFKDKLYFIIASGSGYELWSSDGTLDGTVFAMPVSLPYHPFIAGTDFFYYFARNPSTSKPGLFKSDGTEAGTLLLKDFETIGNITSQNNFLTLNNFLYFPANDGITGSELWKFNLNDETITLVKDIRPGIASSSAFPRHILDGKLYFTANDGITGNEMWTTDGEEIHTSLLKDIAAGTDGIIISNYIAYGNKLFFTFHDDDFNYDFWMTDGTEAGTESFYETLEVGSEPPNTFFVSHNRLFFRMNRKLWESYGTPATTSLADLGVDFDPTYTNYFFAEFDDLLLFHGFTPQTGGELWAIDFRTEEQSVLFNETDKTFGEPDFDLIATASSGLPVMFSSLNKNKLTINESTAHIAGSGQVTIRAEQSGNSILKNAYQDVVINIDKATQALTFDQIPDVKYAPLKKVLLKAGVSTMLPIRFESSDPDIATISGDTAIVKSTGKITITAWQDGNENYKPVSSGEFLLITRADQNISFPITSVLKFDRQRLKLKATSSSGLSLTYGSSSPEIASVEGDSLFIHGVGLVSISATQAGNFNYYEAQVQQPLSIDKGEQTITFLPIENTLPGAEPVTLVSNSSTGLPVIYTTSASNVSIQGGLLTFLSPGRVTIVASQPGNELYAPAVSVEQVFCVNPPTPVISENNEALLLSTNSGVHEWFRGNDVIAGATDPSYSVSKSGIYKTRSVSGDCFSDFSNVITLIITSIEAPRDTEVDSFPNPSSDKVIIKTAEPCRLTIVNSIGEVILDNILLQGTLSEIPVKNLTAGTYAFIFRNGKKIVIKRFSKVD